MKKNKILISIITPSYNSEKTIDKYLESLENLDFKKERFEIIIIDDKSTDQSLMKIQRFRKDTKLNLRVIEKKFHEGFAPTRNAGIKVAKGRILAFSDSDCILQSNWLNKITHYIIEKNEACIGGLVFSNQSFLFPLKRAPVGHRRVTANLAVDTKKTGKVNFNSRFNLNDSGDIDFIARIEKMGFQYKYMKDLQVEHPPIQMTAIRLVKLFLRGQGKVLFIKLHPNKPEYISGNIITTPIVMNRFSPVFFSFLLIIIFSILGLYYSFVFWIILVAVILFTILYLSIFYKKLIYIGRNQKAPKYTLSQRIKSLIFLVLWYCLTVYTRIVGSIKFRYLVI